MARVSVNLQERVPAEVARFIGRFTNNGRRPEVVECFTQGCCWYFAKALQDRFSIYEPILMWDDIEKHFGTMIYDRVYDITGDVTEQYQWERWKPYRVKEPGQAKLIWKNCVKF